MCDSSNIVRKRLFRWTSLIPVTLVAAAGFALLAYHIAHKSCEPRVQEELTIVESVFGPIPEDATECVLTLGIVMDGSDGDLMVRTPAGVEHRRMSWQRRRPPETLCDIKSMKWTSEFLSETGIAKWNQEQLGYRKR